MSDTYVKVVIPSDTPIEGAYSGFAATAMTFLIGALVSGWLVNVAHQSDYAAGVMAGRLQEQESLAHKNIMAERDLKAHGLCVYADLACGYYHFASNVRHHR